MAAGKYRVAQGTQVHHEGVTYPEGASVPLVDAELVTYWLDAGWIESIPTKAARKS
jgi:hypothetical protein